MNKIDKVNATFEQLIKQMDDIRIALNLAVENNRQRMNDEKIEKLVRKTHRIQIFEQEVQAVLDEWKDIVNNLNILEFIPDDDEQEVIEIHGGATNKGVVNAEDSLPVNIDSSLLVYVDAILSIVLRIGGNVSIGSIVEEIYQQVDAGTIPFSIGESRLRWSDAINLAIDSMSKSGLVNYNNKKGICTVTEKGILYFNKMHAHNNAQEGGKNG